LRTADYDQGRRFGNGSGQAGGFGTTNFSGGFGSTTGTGFGTGGNLFGATSASTAPFGSTQTTGQGGGTNLFGTGAGSSLFGPKTTSTGGTGLFSTAGTGTTGFGVNTTGGFGQSTTSPFGGQSQQQTGSVFGSGGTGTSTGFGGFGTQSTTQNTNPFGSALGTGTGTFGNNTTQSQTPSIFGQSQKPAFSGFGQGTTQSQSTGGPFGTSNTTNTGSNLFGSQQASNQTQGNNLFGAGSSTQTGGMFGGGSTSQKPLFGTGTSTTTFGNPQGQNTAGSLFPNPQQGQPQQQSTLFGRQNAGNNVFSQSINKPGGLFGGGTSTSQNQGQGVFGSAASNQGGIVFGQSNQQNSQQPQAFHASQVDGNPYSQASIWTGLPAATPQNSGPLATPLSASQRLKESQSKPTSLMRFTTSKFMTPPRRQGFGFSYSTYGTPNSAASTPGGGGLSTSMYGRGFTGGSFGRSVGKSFSASNLRQQYVADGESVLSPGAFAPGSSRYSSGSIRRLIVNRNVRTDIFNPPSPAALPAPDGDTEAPATNGETASEQPGKLKKRVSFDKDTTGGESNGQLNGTSGALVRTESEDMDTSFQDQGLFPTSRVIKRANGATSVNGETDQTRGNELAVVPEDRESDNVAGELGLISSVRPTEDLKPGDYWMKPTRAELSKIPRDKLQAFKGFKVGRHGCGDVTFDGAVDLTTIPLDDLYDKIVEIRVRSITVYPESSSKPPVGKGLNVPSTLRIENSWPRSRNVPSSATSGPVFTKHLNRLKKMPGTEFVSYDTATGIWTFHVAHYTRYGLDYDDAEGDGDESVLSSPPVNLATPASHQGISVMDVDDGSEEGSYEEDDTFAFKQKIVPGGFGRQSAIDYGLDQSTTSPNPAVVDTRSEASEISEQDDSDIDYSMAGSFPANDIPAPRAATVTNPILKASQQQWGTPGKPLIDLHGDWAEQLQCTISPRKQNRDALREQQGTVLLDRAHEPVEKPSTSTTTDFRTSIDVMNSIFGKHEERMALSRSQAKARPGFEV
jgi:nuclear pore complex protein Nup98-Nup96